MRIALIAPPWFQVPPVGYGGIERVVYLLAAGLAELGHEVTLVGRAGRPFAQKTVDLVEEDCSSLLGGRDEHLRQLVYQTRVQEALSRMSFDLVHDHNEGVGIAFAAASSLPYPFLTTLHGPIGPLLVKLLSHVDRRVGLVAISRAQQSQAAGVHWMGMVYNAVETDLPAPRSMKRDYLIQLARINPDKGQHLAIEAARRLGLRLVLAGKVDPDQASERYFRRQISPHVNNGVTWIRELLGRAKWPLLAGARAEIFPLQWEEPFGLAMAEAMVVGTPVVAFRRGAAPELIEDGVTGFLVEDLDEMVSGVSRIDEIDPLECARRSRERFSASVMARRYERIYREALGSKRPGAPLTEPRLRQKR